MPVTTRNQSTRITLDIQEVKNTVAQVKNKSVELVKNNTSTSIEKVSPDQLNLLHWFTSVIKGGIADMDNNKKKRFELAIQSKQPNITYTEKIVIEKERRTLHFDNIRIATELMFFVEQYLPEVYSISSGMDKFVQVVYTKVQDLYQQIHTNEYIPTSDDEIKSVVSLLYTLQDCEKMVIPFISSDFKMKRRRNNVDYTGMDTIEPEDEFDGITNIWADKTLEEDPDYDPTEDDDEDECLEKYVVVEYESEYESEDVEEDEQDYSEDEEYLPDEDETDNELDIQDENEIFEIIAKSKKHQSQAQKYEEPRKVMKTNNHILFEYDN